MPTTIDFEPLTIDFEPEEPVGKPKMSIGEMMLSQAEGEQQIASGDVPTGEMDQPLLTIPRVPRSTLSDPTMTQEVLRGIQNKTADIVEGLTTPKNLMIGAGAVVAPEIIGLAMLPTLLQGMYGGGKEAYQGIKERDPAKIASGITESGISGLGVLGVGRRPIGDVLAATKIGLPDLESADIAARQGLQPQAAQVRAIIPKPFEQQGIVQTLAQPELQRTAEEGAGRIGADILAKLQAESDAELQEPVPLPQSLATVRNIPEERTPDAIPKRETETLSVGEPPGDSGAVEQGVREQAPAEAPKEEAQATVAPKVEPQTVESAPVESVESIPATENGGRIAIILPNGKAVVGGRIHADTWNRAIDAGVATDAELADGFAGFVKPDGTAWGVNGKPLPKVSQIYVVGQEIPKPPALARQRPPEPAPPVESTPTPKVEPAAAPAAANAPPGTRVFYDDAVKSYTASVFDERFGNMHGKGATEEEAVKALNEHLEAARQHGTWRSVEHPKSPAPALTEGEATEAGKTVAPAQAADKVQVEVKAEKEITASELQSQINKQRGIVKRSDSTKKKGREAKAKLDALESQLREIQSKPSSGETVYWTRESSETDIRRVKPTSGAGMGERVRLSNGQVWEYKGVSGYKVDNLNRVNGWEKIDKPSPSTPPSAEPSVGPGAASPGPGAAARGEPGTYSAIQQLSDRMATAPAKTMRERISFGERMADKATQFKSAVTRTLAKARAIPTAIKSMRSGLRNMNDVTRLVGELDYALQRSAGLSDQATGEIKKGIVNDSMRNGTAIWIDAGGDEAAIRNALAKLPAGTKLGVRRAMEAALKLPDDVKEKAKDLSDYFAVRAQEAVQEGIFKEALEDYFTHIWKNRDNMPDSVKGALNSGRVNEYFQFARKRTIPTLLEGIAQGKEPLLDPAAVVPFYNHALDRAIASRRFIKQLQSLKTEDGRPVVAPSGEGKLIEGVDNDYLLVKTTVTPKQLEGYRAVDHPALKKWKWAATDPESGRQVFYEGNLLVHPDHFERIARMMDRSRLTPWKGTRALLRASGEVKGFKLGVASFFHPIQVGTHALFHLTKPWVSGEPINWDSPQVRLAIEKGGLQLAGDFRLKEQFAEGILSHGLVNKIPGIGPLSRALSDWTFGDYIPKLKLQTFETILARDMKRYAKDIASGKVTQEQVIARAGDAANNAFGELNRLWLGKAGRDPTMQRMLRLVFLAPDFGEARARFVGKALTKYGGEERMALATAVTSLYLAARVGNILSHGDAEVEDPKHMFDVRVGNRWWGVRSIVGDLRHLWDRPRQFWEVRLNPLYARTALAALSGRDPRGHKFTGVTDFAADIGKQFVPIHLGALTRDDQQLWESFAQAIGAQTWKGSATAELHRVAQDWRKSKGITDSTEILAGFDSPYRKARLALEFNDPRKFGEAIQEIEGNLRNRKDPSPRKTIESNFKRYYAMPFSGSNRLETDFKSSLNARDRKLYQEAQVERKALYQKFKSWY